MFAPAVFWPTFLGVVFLIAGIVAWRRDDVATLPPSARRLVALGPAFVASALAAFAGEHFTAAPSLATIVPKFMPAPLAIAYVVGVAHLSAATSFVSRRAVRWAAAFLALMFALFVLLMDLPGAFRRPELRIAWSLAARQATFSIGALALFAIVTRATSPARAALLARVARYWTAFVLVFYGIENAFWPRFWPGVPDTTPAATWVPAPAAIAVVTGVVLVACGIAMLVEARAALAAAAGGAVMLLLTLALYVPWYFLSTDAGQYVTALNFVFDTMLFGGTLLVISRAIAECAPPPAT